MSSIARRIVKPPATAFSYLLYDEGSSPRSRTRRVECLSAQERARGTSFRAIGLELGRSASTISREVSRNCVPGKYRACNTENGS